MEEPTLATTYWRFILRRWLPIAADGIEFQFRLIVGVKSEEQWKEWLKIPQAETNVELEYIKSDHKSVNFRKVRNK